MTLKKMKKVLNQLPSRISNAIVSAALPSIAESVSQNLAAQFLQSLPADNYPQQAPPAANTPTQSASMPSAPCSTPNAQETSSVSNGFLPEGNAGSNDDLQEASPVSNGFSRETRPVSNGFSREESTGSNGFSAQMLLLPDGFSPALDADGLPSCNLPPLPAPAAFSLTSAVANEAAFFGIKREIVKVERSESGCRT